MRKDDAVDDYVYLGTGPSATGDGAGWNMDPALAARCRRCCSFVCLDPNANGDCECGAIHKDPDAGRFGSVLGDAAIDIYRRKG